MAAPRSRKGGADSGEDVPDEEEDGGASSAAASEGASAAIGSG